MRITFRLHLERAQEETHYQLGHMLSQATKLGKCTRIFKKKKWVGDKDRGFRTFEEMTFKKTKTQSVFVYFVPINTIYITIKNTIYFIIFIKKIRNIFLSIYYVIQTI